MKLGNFLNSKVSDRCMGYLFHCQLTENASKDIWGPRVTRVFTINPIRLI